MSGNKLAGSPERSDQKPGDSKPSDSTASDSRQSNLRHSDRKQGDLELRQGDLNHGGLKPEHGELKQGDIEHSSMKPGDLRVGLDIGATKVLGAAMDAGGAVVAQARRDTAPGPDGILGSALAVLDLLATDLDGVRPSHIGIGIPGMVDRDRGAVRHAVNLGLGGDWFPLAARLADRTGATVVVENDLNAATWGAHVLSGADDLAYLSLGTGLAAGFVLSGRLRRGVHGAAGEIGHVPVDPQGPVCSCGQRGCLELIASGSALSAAWPTAGEVPPASALFAAADAGDPAAVAARDQFAAGVADAVRMAGLAVDPVAIIIGGGVAHVGEPLRAAVAAALRAQAATSPFLAALDLAARVSLLPDRLPVAAIGAALIGNAA